MRANARNGSWIATAAATIGVMGLAAVVPSVGQTSPNPLLQSDRGGHNNAEENHSRSWQEAKVGDAQLAEAEQLNQQVIQLYEQGQYAAAIPLAERAIAICEKVLGKEHPDVANSLNNLAGLYDARGNYTAAEPLYQRSLAIREKVLGKEHLDVATSLNNLAGLYQEQGNYTAAEPLSQRSLAIREKVLGKEHPDVATSLNNLASLYVAQGNYTAAEPLSQRSLAIREKVLGKEHPDVALSLNNLAGLYSARGDIARALEFLSRGTNIEERNLALIFTTGSEAQKSAYIATLWGTTNGAISLQAQGAPNNPQATRLALTTVLRRKGRVLDALTDSLLSLRQNLKPEDQALLDQLAATRSQLATLLFKGVGNVPPDLYRQQVATLKDQADGLEATLARRSAEFRTESQPVTLESVQQLIPADAALVELVLYQPLNPKATKPNERWGKPRYVAYILHRKGDPVWVDLGEARAIDQAVNDFRKALRDRTKSPKRVARTLDEQLMRPIRQRLGNTRTVLLSPDSQLNLIPFAALVDENDRYLVENYSITYLSSGRDLLRLQNRTNSRSAPVIVANPDYNNPGSSLGQTVNRSAKSAQTRSTDNQRSTELAKLQFGSLAGTAEEAKAIAPMLPGARLFADKQATENAIKQLQAPKILHIATHGFFLKNVPQVAPTAIGDSTLLASKPSSGALTAINENPLLRSGIALAGFNPRSSSGEDGVLTALEVAGLNLSGTKLVVLSACETGLGDVANGEGVYGLRRALAIAGASSQVISLWKVDDFATKDLMVSYYKRLKANVDRTQALRQTQLEMLSNRNYRHPYYWAAFISSGDWTGMGEAFR